MLDKNTFRERVTFRGHVSAFIEHDDGRTEVIEQANVVTTPGRNRYAALLTEESTAFPDYVAVGTGTTAAATSDTALETEVYRSQIVGRSNSTGVSTYKAFFGKDEANGSTLSEAGLFDLSTGGTMFCRALFASPIEKVNTMSVTITWTVTITVS